MRVLGRRHRADGRRARPSTSSPGPTTGGVILAFETGRQLGTRAIFAEEVASDDGPRREFRRGFKIRPGERVLLVDDILTTGGSLLAMIPAVEAAGRRDRRVRRPRRPLRRPVDADVADDRPRLPAAGAVAARAADLRARTRRPARDARRASRPSSPAAAAPAWARVTAVHRAARPARGSARSVAAVLLASRRSPARRRRPRRQADRLRVDQRARQRDAGRQRRLADRRDPDRHRRRGPTRSPGSACARTTARRSRSRSAPSRTARSSRPGHLAEHLATPSPVRRVLPRRDGPDLSCTASRTRLSPAPGRGASRRLAPRSPRSPP